MLAKKTSKNQITLPKRIVDSLPGTDYFDVSLEAGRIVLRPVLIRGLDQDLQEIRDKVRRLGMGASDVAAAVRWARRRDR